MPVKKRRLPLASSLPRFDPTTTKNACYFDTTITMKKATKSFGWNWRFAAVGLCNLLLAHHLPARADEFATAVAAMREDVAKASKSVALLDFEKANEAIRKFQSEDRSFARRQKLELWAKLRSALQAVIDPNFGEKDFPEANVGVPGSGNSDISPPPESVRDPKIRKEYERLLAKNEQLRVRSHLQISYLKMLQKIDFQVAYHIIDRYPSTPAELERLRKELEGFDNREEILVHCQS